MGMDEAQAEQLQAQTVIVDDARLRLLPHGPERLELLLTHINAATRQIDCYYYIIGTDAVACQLVEALTGAAQRGVKVTLLIDAFGSASTPDSLFRSLIDAGGRFGRFGWRHSMRYLIRNHQKMALFDGDVAIIGGFNLAHDYFADADDPRGWRDFGLMIEGAAVVSLQRWFDGLCDWTMSSEQSFHALRKLVRDWRPGEGAVRWLMGGPTRRLNGWTQSLKHDLQSGQQLDMAAAYFSPGWSMMRRLAHLARRGRARFILPWQSDNMATVGAARHCYHRLLKAGARLHEFLPQKLHAKLIVIDAISYIGSANIDMRSLFLNVELMLRVEDDALAALVRSEMDKLTRASRNIDDKVYQSMATPWRRLRWWFDHWLVGVFDYTVTRRLVGLRRKD